MKRQLLGLLTLVLTSQAAAGGDAKPSQQKRAVAAIEKLGGEITIDRTQPGNPVVEVSLKRRRVEHRTVTDGDCRPVTTNGVV